MKADISRGTTEYNLLQDFCRLRRDYHHRGENETVDQFLDDLTSAAQKFMDRYKSDPQLFRFAGMLATMQILDCQQRDCYPDQPFKLVIKRKTN